MKWGHLIQLDFQIFWSSCQLLTCSILGTFFECDLEFLMKQSANAFICDRFTWNINNFAKRVTGVIICLTFLTTARWTNSWIDLFGSGILKRQNGLKCQTITWNQFRNCENRSKTDGNGFNLYIISEHDPTRHTYSDKRDFHKDFYIKLADKKRFWHIWNEIMKL